MKIYIILISLLFVGTKLFAQEVSQKLPPLHMLPKDGESKFIYEFDHEGIYQVYNAKGDLLLDSIGEFIDMTQLEKGMYFIKFEGETFSCNKQMEKPKVLVSDPK